MQLHKVHVHCLLLLPQLHGEALVCLHATRTAASSSITRPRGVAVPCLHRFTPCTALYRTVPPHPVLQEVHEIIHRVERLQDMMGGTAAAADMLATHPQLLTRPPAALEQQLINLAAWLRLPLGQTQSPGQAGSGRLSGPVSGHLSGCQDLMGLVRTSPGVLFLSKQQVAAQLAAMQQLLQLPSLPKLLDEDLAVSQQLLADVHHMQQQQQQDVAGDGVQGVPTAAADDHQWLVDEQAQIQEQQEQQQQQMKKALRAWRKAAQQQQQHAKVSVAAAGGGELARERWAGRLVCHAPDWLFVDPHVTMPRRVDYLARLLFGSSVTKPSSSGSSSSIPLVRKVSALLLDAPQLIGVNPSSVLGKVRTLQQVLQQHPGYALQQQWQWQQQQLQQLGAGLDSKQDSTAKQRKGKGQQQQQLQLLQGAEDVVPLLLQSPLLLVQQAKQLEKNGSELLQRLPGLPLYHLLLLLPQHELHWQQLQFLQHLQLLPAGMRDTPATAHLPTAHQHSSSSSRSSKEQASVWTEAHLQLATDALSLQPASFVGHYPQYPAWQAALAAADASSRDWRSAWGWLQELQQQLAGPACSAWLQQLSGKWQRLLLLAAGEQWREVRPVGSAAEKAAAAAAAVAMPTGSSSSRRRRSSRTTSSSHAASATAAAVAQGVGLSGAVSLRQVADLPGSGFPYRPAAAAGPIPWDLPQPAIQQLLSSSKAALDSELSRLSGVWQQLVAAAEGVAVWQQQLGDAAGLLPQAMIAAGWKLPAGVSKAVTSSSNEGGVTASWVEECMESRAGGVGAAAALTARQQFWQHLQQPGVLSQLCSRLQFIQQAGLAQLQQQQHAGSSSSGGVDPSSVWSLLAASDAAFASAHPEFVTWQQLQSLVSDKPGWADELAGLQGQQLLMWLQQAAAGWWRLAYLCSDAGGEAGGIWQAISMSDALNASDAVFVDMFPEARYSSWQVLAQLRDEDGSSSSSSAGAPGSLPLDKGPPAVASPFAQDGAAAKPTSSSGSSAKVPRSRKPRADTAAQRLQLLQDYASLHPSWEAELRAWRKETWSTATRTFVPLKARRLEFVLQMLEPQGYAADRSSSSSGGGVEGAESAAAAAAPYVPDLQLLVTAANVHFLRRFPLFTAWHEVGSAVQAVPRWSAEWHALRGSALRQLLQQVEQLRSPDPQAVRQQAYEQRLELLRSKLAQLQQQHAGAQGSDVSQVLGQSALLKHLSLTSVGVTYSSSSSSSGGKADDEEAAGAGAAAGFKRSRARLTALAAQHSRQQQQRQLHGLELALHRLAHFSSGLRASKAAKDLSLQQLLMMPEVQLVQLSPGLDPALTAAQAQGATEADSRFLEEVYPWLGLKALSPEVQQGLSPKVVKLLEERADDLLLLQQLAHTWPAWEQQLQGYAPPVVELLLRRVRVRSERLQVIVR
jgi:hypothetical protein